MTAIRVLAVGCGWVTTERHLPAIARTPGLRLAGVVDRRPERARAAARRWRVPGARGLADVPVDAFDAVSIGTYPPAHEELALRAIELGKHVIVEKPLAMTAEGARRVVDAARSRGVAAAVVHNFQFARSVSRARAIASSGRDGALRGILGVQLSNERRRLPTWYRELPGGLFYDEAPHLFYLARAFGGALEVASAHAAGPLADGDPTPRAVSAHLTTARGVPCTLQFEFGAALSEWQLILMLERATLFCDIFRDVFVRVPDDGRHTARQIMGTSVASTLAHWSGVARSGALLVTHRLDYGNGEVFRRFAAGARDGAPLDGISAADGAATVAAMHAVIDRAGIGDHASSLSSST